MRRPIVPVCGGFVSGTVSAYLIMMKYGAAENFAVFAITAVAIAVALSLLLTEKSIAERMLYDCSKCRIKSSETCLLFMLAFILSSVLMYAETAKTDSMAEKAGSVCDINGTVLFAEEKERGEKYRLIIRSGTGEKILVTAAGKNETIPNSICRQFNYREIVGCCVSMRTYIELPQGKRNPKCFDYRLYLRSRGVQTAANVSIAQISIEERPQSLYTKWLHAISVFKGDFYEKLLLYTDEESAAMMMGMLFGEKNLIDGDIKELYQKNGTAHVLAVSGLHTGALYACVSKLMRKKRSVTGNMLTAMLFMTYTAMAGFSPSVMRASGMILIHIFADMRHRRYDMLSAACLCAIISILRNPFSVFDTGFQLSYTAIVTIAIAASALRYLPYGKLISLFSVQFGTLPITVYIFNYFSIGSFAANIPVIFIAGLTVPAGMAAFVLCNINNVLFSIASRTAVMLCEFMTFINELTYAGGRLTFDAVSPSLFFMVLYYGIVLGGMTETALVWYARHSIKKISAAVCLIVLAGLVVSFTADDGFKKADIVFVDVGQGDCLHIKSGGRHYLIDGGGSASYDVGENILKPYLLKNGAWKVDIAFVSHLHKDHYAGIVSLCRNGMIKYLCIYEGNRSKEEEILAKTGLTREQIFYVKAGDCIPFAGGGKVTVLSPEKAEAASISEEDENKSSLIMRVECGGISVIMNGDISAEAETELVRKFTNTDKGITKTSELLSCDILKAAHHGSRYSSCDEFVSAVSPAVMMFQTGKNNYGHPDKSLIEKCLEKGIMVYRNDTDGAVGFYRAVKTANSGKESTLNKKDIIKAVTVRKD